MAVPLDPTGNATLGLQIVILFLLVLGLPFVKGKARADFAEVYEVLVRSRILLYSSWKSSKIVESS